MCAVLLKHLAPIFQIMCGNNIIEGQNTSRLQMSKTFTIDVENVNEPPFNITLSSLSIEEANFMDQVVGEITAIDPDSNTVRYVDKLVILIQYHEDCIFEHGRNFNMYMHILYKYNFNVKGLMASK